MNAPWTPAVDAEVERRYAAAGFGRPIGLGERPALLVIDVQYRTVGNTPKPFDEALGDYTTACGKVGWDAVANITPVVALFRERGWPVIYPHVAPKGAHDAGRLGAKVPAIMDIPAKGYEFVADIAPTESDLLIPKKHPSAFFATPLVSHLVDLGVDTLVITGCTTSGCIRSSTVDAFAYNFRVLVPHDACYDRAEVIHQVNLFDIGQKYADVMSTAEAIETLRST
ncbi:isochorismatase family protein [Actinophytocola sp.]|uniref:isochorismatase family protein n=1 Tax=Actinophytocola sp. TaxID=1872138 RepID=UPI003D6BD354